MVPGQKNIILRYTLIVFIMALLAIAIIAKAAIIMFAERQYWKDVADRFIKENVLSILPEEISFLQTGN